MGRARFLGWALLLASCGGAAHTAATDGGSTNGVGVDATRGDDATAADDDAGDDTRPEDDEEMVTEAGATEVPPGTDASDAALEADAPLEPPAIVSIAVDPGAVTLNLTCTSTVQYAAVGSYADGSHKTVTTEATWSSTDPAHMAIGPTGFAAATGSAASGSVGIFATLGGATGYAEITLAPLITVSISVRPLAVALLDGQTVQLSATLYLPDGTSCDRTSQVQWVSSSPGIVAVSSTGLVAASGIGSAEITATFEGQTSNQATVAVASQ